MADDALSRLTQDEKTALAALLKRTIADDRYPLSPRIGVLRGILAKLEPPRPAPAPLPPQKAYDRPRHTTKQRGARMTDDGPRGQSHRSQLRQSPATRQTSPRDVKAQT